MPVLYSRSGDIAILTLNEPQRRNALSRASVAMLFELIERSHAEKARAIVIAANGPVFCAGANIDDLKAGWMSGTPDPTDPALLFRALAEETRPTIAALQGGALGGGFELTLSCDLVVMGTESYVALPELGHGVIPNTALARLHRVVGARRATELVLTRRRLSAAQAVDWGLANRLVPTADVLSSAIDLALGIVQSAPPGAIAAAKRNLAHHGETDWVRVLASPGDVPAAEWREGLRSFDERRKPSYDQFWQDM
ncbi:enoyl-CoA hydratase/carnithine racemase [Bradyrhizobium japonicum]|uniref:enoyl-CoA hydratase/isomerase family protein n=1 Tax=Bradyrhizobium TaxID=374 RepID=UPI000425B7E6|nr:MULTISPECIES: enoyl-CoA hydratase/isomerase family protein [Bradyrhizobium]MBR0880513.1 enoyl-CoA hydratase/isomerase family protein [Bradyrhizobium liaoningense]MBR0999584.1 enoyl-CoA hydratase/isomerase family protein [Bradyrhizobium liaoningense]MBR1065201.1 enoyl-CoA hydratase/isomerase family protein [Bradyrhizobium liaoningense]MCP1740140.1 enoyl-CoA hydratase [Bradyrhizobium japonicum]MCP1778373.1 enoyl-CoA hydratase [Bradyrhizobium japonicum]